MKKNKFIETQNYDYNKQRFYEINKDENSYFDLLKNNYNDKDKSNVTLKKSFDPYDYNLNYYNSLKKKSNLEENNYFPAFDQGPGRGFGNLNINNQIRNSASSRNDNTDFKSFKEAEIVDRFQFIDTRYVNPKNIVLPFPRSGDTTRKVASINVIGEDILDNHSNNFYLNNTNNVEQNNYDDLYQNKYNNIYQNIEQNKEEILESNKIINNLPNQNIIDNVNLRNNTEKQEQINFMKHLQPIKNTIYNEGQEYKKKLSGQLNNSSSKVPEYRLDEIKPNDIRLFDFLPANSIEFSNSLEDFYSNQNYSENPNNYNK